MVRAAPREEDALLRPALRHLFLVWAAELILARLTSDAQDPLDLLKSLAVLGFLGLAPLPLARLAPAGRPRRFLAALAAAAPWGFVLAGVLAAPAMAVRPRYGPVAVALTGLLLLTRAAVLGLRGRPPWPRPWTVPLSLAAASGVAWWCLFGSPWPGLGLAAGLAALWALAAFLAATRRAALPGLLLLGTVTALWPDAGITTTWPAARGDAQGPDVVLLCVDTLRYDRATEMQSYRRLAEAGVEFTAAQASGPWTLPSMASAMTGLEPWSHGAGSGPNHVYLPLSREYPTLAELFSAAGYDTAAVVYNPVLAPAMGFARGFQLWDSASVRVRYALPRTRVALEARPFAAHLLPLLLLAGRRPFYEADYLADQAERVLEHRRPDRPLLLWVHFFDCHFPYRYAHELSDVPWKRRMTLERGKAELYKEDPFWATPEGHALLLRAYDHQVEATDAALGRLLDALGPPPERGRIVVLFSDHGEEFFEHGGVEHGHAFWQEVIHVPLVIAGLPGVAPGTRVGRVVSHADLLPTLLHACGVERPVDGGPMQGRDLAGEIPDEPRISENVLHYQEHFDEAYAVRAGRWKAIYGPGERVLLFDLEADPQERTNLAAEHPDLVKALRERPERIRRDTADLDATDPEVQRALAGMGYTGFDED